MNLGQIWDCRWITGMLVATVGGLAFACSTGQRLGEPVTQAGLAAPDAVAAPPLQKHSYTQKIPGTGLAFDMVRIPGGKVAIGSQPAEENRGKDEGPPFEVEIEPFYMGKFEVTWDLYNDYLNQYALVGQRRPQLPIEKLADAVSYPTPIYDWVADPVLQPIGGRQGKLPVVTPSHFAAKQFTKWLSAKTGRFYRLPTEAEWEYAARAGTRTAYFFGDDAKQLGDYAWYYDNAELANGDVGYHEVGKKKPNPFGLYDIYGNVAEIVLDQYDAEWYARHAGKTVPWRDAVRWPDRQYPRVGRGGSYESDPEDCRSAARRQITIKANQIDPASPKDPWWWANSYDIGFRVVAPVRTPPKEEQHRFWDADSEELKKVLDRDREVRQLMDELRAKRPEQ